MLLTITSTTPPATDLGYLLAKIPARLHTFDLAFGKVHVFYPEASPERCTAAMLLDVDPAPAIHLVTARAERLVLRLVGAAFERLPICGWVACARDPARREPRPVRVPAKLRVLRRVELVELALREQTDERG